MTETSKQLADLTFVTRLDTLHSLEAKDDRMKQYSNRYSNLGDTSRFSHEKSRKLSGNNCTQLTLDEFSHLINFEGGVPQITYDFITYITAGQVNMREVSKALAAENQGLGGKS